MNGLKQTLSFILVLVILTVSIFTETVFSFAAETDNNEKSVVNYSSLNGDYGKYLEKYNYKNGNSEIQITYRDNTNSALIIPDEEFENILIAEKDKEIEFDFSSLEDSSYNLEIYFSPNDEMSEKFDFSLKIDGNYPFEECKELELSAFWENDGKIRKLTNGDEVNPIQRHKKGFSSQKIIDKDGIENSPYQFMLSKGNHKLSIKNSGREFLIAKIIFTPIEVIKSYDDISKDYKNLKKYDGEQIVIEGENALYKNSYSLSSKSEQGTADVSPSSPTNAVINYIGGTTWNTPGSEITWEVSVPKDGLYKLGIAFKQSYVTDGEVYRMLKIDGKVPFKEAGEISFPYASRWQFKELNNDGKDCLIYLEKGKHTLSLSVTLSDISEVFKQLKNIVEPLGNLYIDIVMITGENPDKNRDYELQNQIPDFEKTLKDAYNEIEDLSAKINGSLRVNGELGGALKNMARIIKEMTDNLYDSHLQLSSFYSAQQTLSAWLYDIKNMSLAIDQIVIASPDKEFVTPKASFMEHIKFFIMRYSNSYVSMSNRNNSSDDETLPTIKIWVNWGRDQVKVLNSLIQDSFTPKHNVNVLVEQVNATLVQGVISGNSPDLYLHMARTEPVNLAMRGVLYNLQNFKDFDQVVSENCSSGATIPYMYQNGTYALPDTQNFFVLFYRKDIFDKLSLEVPKTWDEFLSVTGILQRNKMNTYLPYTKLGAAGTVNIGAGGLTIFPTMLMQRGAKMYNDTQNATNLASKESVSAFKFWTEFYTEYSLDQDANFYQKFRVGTIPMGIANYTQYLQIKIGAPEISGKWGIAEIPGIKQKDGTINNLCSGAGTGVSVMKSGKNKEAAWQFVKWWISSDTQYRYSADVESIIGETGRISSANKDAVSRLSWDEESLNVILNQWNKVNEIPEVPGSYYVSRSIDQAFWATKNGKKSAKESIMDWSVVSDKEIQRKIKEYAGRSYGG